MFKGETVNAILQEFFFLILERDLMDHRERPSRLLRRVVQLMKNQGMNPKAILQAERANFPVIDGLLRDINIDHNWAESA